MGVKVGVRDPGRGLLPETWIAETMALSTTEFMIMFRVPSVTAMS